MNASIEIPDFLTPDEGVKDIGAFRLLGIYELVDRFSKEFQIDHEIAFASLLAGFSHSIGGAFEIDSTLGVIRPPFSLLLVTPESDAIWPRIPTRFLVDDFENTMRAFAKVNLPQKEDSKDSEDDQQSHPVADHFANTVETAKAVYADKVSERISTPSLEMPFPRVPFDHHVLLTTPPVGLCRAFRQLSSENKVRLEQALSSGTPLRPRAGEESGAAPSFFWQAGRGAEVPGGKSLGRWVASFSSRVRQTGSCGTLPGRGCCRRNPSTVSRTLCDASPRDATLNYVLGGGESLSARP